MPPTHEDLNPIKDNRAETVLPMNSGKAPLADTREKSIADSIKRSEEVQKHFPDVDFTGGVIKPTVRFLFDLKGKISGDKQKEYNNSMGQLVEHAGEPEKAAKLLYQARNRLCESQDVLALFDTIFVKRRQVSSNTFSQLQECLAIKSQIEAKKDPMLEVNNESEDPK